MFTVPAQDTTYAIFASIDIMGGTEGSVQLSYTDSFGNSQLVDVNDPTGTSRGVFVFRAQAATTISTSLTSSNVISAYVALVQI